MSVTPHAPRELAAPSIASATLAAVTASLPQHDHCVALLAMDRLSVADVDCR